MSFIKYNSVRRKGFSLIEIIVSLGIVMVMTVGVYSLIIFSLKITVDNKFYVEAIEVANQRLEKIRNMPYADVAVVGGIPNGPIPQVETIMRNNSEFTINNYITYYDDAYDGSTPADTIPTDYKIVTVKVSWKTPYNDKSLTVFSKVIPRTEETDEGYGLLKLFIIDSNSIAVPNASVRTVSPSLGIDVTNIAGADGILYLPAPESTDYEITTTKAGYGTDYSYDPSTGMTPVHLAVTIGNKKEESFKIDKLSVIDIQTFSDNLPDNWMVNNSVASSTQSKIEASIDSADNMYFTWENSDGLMSTVYVQKYNSANTKQWLNDLAIHTTNYQQNPDIETLSNGNSLVVWQDNSVTLKQIALHNSKQKIVYKDVKFVSQSNAYNISFLQSAYDNFGIFFNNISSTIETYKFFPNFFIFNPANAAEIGTIVQTKIGGTNNNYVLGMSTTFDTSPIEGNVIIAIATKRNVDGTFALPTNSSGSFTESYSAESSYDLETGIWHKVIGAGEPSTVTITSNDNMRGGHLMIMEVSNLDTTNLIDVTSHNDQTSNNSNTANTGDTPVSTDSGFAVAAINFADNDFNTPTSADWSSASADTWTQRMWVDWWRGRDSSLAVATLDVSAADQQRATLTLGGAGGEQRKSILVVFNTISPDEVTVSSIDSQTTSMMIPSADQDVGGAFVITDTTGTHTITDITISEGGTVDAQNDISSVDLYYDIDSSAPYDCTSESLDIFSDSQFGSSEAFDAPDGIAAFSDLGVGIDTTNSLCLYVVTDIAATADKDDTLEIFINNPSTDIVSNTGNVSPASSIEIASTTDLLLPANLNQIHYRFRNDDGDESGASWQSDMDSPATTKINTLLRLRFEFTNTGSLDTANTEFRLEYGEKVSTCGAIATWNSLPTDNSLHWKISSSLNLSDADPTTNISGVTDENSSFLPGFYKDTGNQTSALSLTPVEFTDIEYAIEATSNASDKNYCLRLTNAGSVVDMTYSSYAEISIIGDNNIYLKKIDSNGNDLWAIKKVNTNMDNSDQSNPVIASTENFGNATTVIAWVDERNGNKDIYMQGFDSLGNKIWGTDIQVTSSSTDESEVFVGIDNSDNILTTWVHDSDIYIQKYDLDGNSSYANHINLSNSTNNCSNPKIKFDSTGNIYVSWTSEQATIYNIILSKYDSTLSNLWTTNPNLDEISKNQSYLDFDISGSDIFIAWTDNRKGNNDIYTQKLDLSGNIQWTKDQKINNDSLTANQNSPAVLINSLGATFSAWNDERNGFIDVYATEFTSPGVSVSKANVPLVLTGTKKISLTPLLYEYDKIIETDAAGSVSVQVEWDKEPGYSLMTHSASTTLNISSCDPACPFEIQPDEIKTINVYVQ